MWSQSKDWIVRQLQVSQVLPEEIAEIVWHGERTRVGIHTYSTVSTPNPEIRHLRSSPLPGLRSAAMDEMMAPNLLVNYISYTLLDSKTPHRRSER
jgi:hypothetical protein